MHHVGEENGDLFVLGGVSFTRERRAAGMAEPCVLQRLCPTTPARGCCRHSANDRLSTADQGVQGMAVDAEIDVTRAFVRILWYRRCGWSSPVEVSTGADGFTWSAQEILTPITRVRFPRLRTCDVARYRHSSEPAVWVQGFFFGRPHGTFRGW